MQITKKVHAIKIPFQVKTDLGTLERFVYAYLIIGESPVLIDTGVASSEEIIFNYLDELGLKPEDISLLILSHSHPDHIGSAQSIQEKSYCQVAAHVGEKSWIEDVNLQASERPVPDFHSLVEGSVDVDIILEDMDEFELGAKLTLEVLHTPGHSPGSISLLLKEDGILFCGDAVPLKGDLPIYDDYQASVESVHRLKDLKNLNYLLSSWDDPKSGDEINETFDDALEYLGMVDEAVFRVLRTIKVDKDPMEFCKLVLVELGLPVRVANPIVARSFQDNRKLIMEKDLF
jgi:hydroxyacylglutathione hydrolase